MGFPKDYAIQMQKKFGYQVVWPPNTLLEIGDFGVVPGGKHGGRAFTKLGNIKDKFGITAETETGALSPVETLQSEGVSIVNVSGGGGGTANGVNFEVQLDVKFEKKNSMVYNGSDMTPISVKNLYDFGQQLAQLLKDGKWEKNWVVVTDVHQTMGLTVLLSQSSNTSVTLGGNAGLTSGNIAKASANVQIVNSSAAIANYMSAERTTPLLKARAVKKGGIQMQMLEANSVLRPSGDIIPLQDDLEMEVVDFDYCDLDKV